MIGAYIKNQLLRFHDILLEAIRNYDPNNFSSIDISFQMILASNGCKFAVDDIPGAELVWMHEKENQNDVTDYALYFVSNALGNDANDSLFDFVHVDGIDYLVIFMDYFKDINSEPSDNDFGASEILGKSRYFDAIVKLVNIFISSSTNPAVFTPMLATTSVASVYRIAPYVIASSIIYNIYGELNEVDIHGIEIGYAKECICKLQSVLYGVR